MTAPMSPSWNAFGTVMLLRTVVIIVLVICTTQVEASFSTAFHQLPPLAARRLLKVTPSSLDESSHQHSKKKSRSTLNGSTREYSTMSLLCEKTPLACECEPNSSKLPTTRRSILRRLAASSSLAAVNACLLQVAWADNEGESVTSANTRGDRKPYAPLENLLPATRVKVLIDKAVDTATALQDGSNDSQKKARLTAQLKSLLLEPHEFFKTKDEVLSSKTYLDKKTWSDWKRARQEETMNKFQITQVDPATELNEAFEQWGERRQFKRLRRQQLALEQSNKMRAAFNAYTNNLVFGESYTLNASREEKKRMIRQYDQLPDVTSVIRSDLDLRDLYRNQVLTAMDDAKAELQYQLASSDDDEPSMDFKELLSILREAQSSCNEWFNFVPENDLRQALDVVLQEEN